MFEGFIFDVEGTLLDSVAQNQHSLLQAEAEISVQHRLS